MERAIDPVCGMTVERDKAAATAKHGERTFYFCSDGCKREFENAPERYARNLADMPNSRDANDAPFTQKGGVTAPKFGSAGSGGAEYEKGPEGVDRGE